MAIIEGKLLTTEQTVIILTAYLGGIAKWQSLLMEIRRTLRPGLRPAYLHGLRLEPFGKNGASPRYRPADVVAFIRGIRAIDPTMRIAVATPPDVEAEEFVFDDNALFPWKWRELHPIAARAPRRCRHLKPAPTDGLITVGEKHPLHHRKSAT